MMTEVCPYCRGPIANEETPAVCDGCGTRHHADCYAENGGCTIFGCSCAPTEEPKLSVSTPELVSVATTASPAVSGSQAPVPPPPPGRNSAPPMVGELRQITNRVVPSLFGSFADYDTVQDPEPVFIGPPKNRTTYIVLGALLGAFGAHNFYAGYTKKAAAQLAITVLTLGFGSPMSWIWAIIDICTIGQDSQGVQFES
jgi:hypothetical protein